MNFRDTLIHSIGNDISHSPKPNDGSPSHKHIKDLANIGNMKNGEPATHIPKPNELDTTDMKPNDGSPSHTPTKEWANIGNMKNNSEPVVHIPKSDSPTKEWANIGNMKNGGEPATHISKPNELDTTDMKPNDGNPSHSE